MRLKYKVRQHSNDGQWYVYRKPGTYWTTPYATERLAIEASLYKEGAEILAKLDNVQERMESLPGFISRSDPYGWRA
jgi:hypothetical protein